MHMKQPLDAFRQTGFSMEYTMRTQCNHKSKLVEAQRTCTNSKRAPTKCGIFRQASFWKENTLYYCAWLGAKRKATVESQTGATTMRNFRQASIREETIRRCPSLLPPNRFPPSCWFDSPPSAPWISCVSSIACLDHFCRVYNPSQRCHS